jgi:TonB family protein
MLQNSPAAQLSRPQVNFSNRQPRRLQIALLLLLVALGVVLAKDRDFWFGSDQTADSDSTGPESTPKLNSPAATAKTAPAPVARIEAAKIETAKNHTAPKTATKAITEPAQQEAANQDSPVVATTRAALPPLDVEVVAGDAHRTVHPGSNITKVEIPGNSNRVSAAVPGVSTNAAERELLPAGAVPELRQSLDVAYPLLGQHTRVQGSVVLQAVVGTDGIIEDLRVLSGPSILTAAAQQAVRQWRFKPYLQNGQPVETKARIVVNFSIRVSDNPATS